MEAIIFTTAITATISALVGTIISGVIMFVRTKGHDTYDSQKAMMSGIRALLWRELKNIHTEAMRDGLTCEELKHLENVYSSYHGIGGNGTGTKLYEEAMKTRVEND